jgi:hypothetical protein
MTMAASTTTGKSTAFAQGPQKLSVGLLGEAASSPWQRLFDGLGELFPLEFHRGNANGRALDAVIVFAKKPQEALALVPKGVPAYVAISGIEGEIASANPEIRFADSAGLDRCLRHQGMDDRELKAFAPLVPAAGDDVLASRDNQPLWIRRSAPGASMDVVAVCPPAVRSTDYVCEFFTAGRFMRMLPLLVFLRKLTKPIDWRHPGLLCIRRSELVLDVVRIFELPPSGGARPGT